MGKHKISAEKYPRKNDSRCSIYDGGRRTWRNISKCSTSGELPRGRQQVKEFLQYAKRQRAQNTADQIRDDDPWFRLLGEGKKQASLITTAFVHDARVASQPLCVMATNRQIKDLKRFFCHPTEYEPFIVDPTFNIGV